MSGEQEKMSPMMEYAAQKYAPVNTETTTETEIVPEINSGVTTDATASTEIVETTTSDTVETPTPASTDAPATIDYSDFLTKESEGLFTDVNSFKAALPKIKEYDTKVTEYEALLATKTELEEKVKTMITPANEYAKTLNEMLLAGKSVDEIENFTKISKLDLDNISPIDGKVMVMVMNGYSEDIAREIVEEEFPIADYEEGSKERRIIEEKLRVSFEKEDREILKAYKKDLTTIDNSAQVQAQEQAEQQRLQGIAKTEEHKLQVQQQIPKIAEGIIGLGEKNLNGKEGDEAIKLNFDYSAEYKAEIPAKVASFFLDAQMEFTPENIALVEKYIKADYLERNFDQMAQSIYKHAEAITTEKIVNKYENRTGLPAESTSVVVDNSKQDYNDFLNKVAKGR